MKTKLTEVDVDRGIVINNLPQPTSNATRPEKVTICAQAGGNMVDKGSEDGSVPSLMQNGVCSLFSFHSF